MRKCLKARSAKTKKSLAAFLAVIMLLSATSITALAEEVLPSEPVSSSSSQEVESQADESSDVSTSSEESSEPAPSSEESKPEASSSSEVSSEQSSSSETSSELQPSSSEASSESPSSEEPKASSSSSVKSTLAKAPAVRAATVDYTVTLGVGREDERNGKDISISPELEYTSKDYDVDWQEQSTLYTITVRKGQNVELTMDASGNNGETYRWDKVTGSSYTSVGTNKTLSINTSATGTTRYRGTYTYRRNNGGTRIRYTAYIDVIVVEPTATAKIVANPTGKISIGSPVALSAATDGFDDGSALSYRWFKDGVELQQKLTEEEIAAGVTSKGMYLIDSMTNADAGNYTVEVTGLFSGESKTVLSAAYALQARASTATVYPTSDTSGVIDLRLFDYNKAVNNVSGGLRFTTGGHTEADGSKTGSVGGTGGANSWTGSGEGVYQGILASKIADGASYPQIVTGGTQNLGYLFGSSSTNYKTAYPSANYLLRKTGDYYEYDSSNHHAAFNTVTQRFTLWNYTAGVSGYTAGFFPFNDFNADRDGQNFTIDYADTNYWFGMEMGFDFIQPENGILNGNNMQFSFSGDDDVWVYIDDMLFLDLGGIHDKASGTIDFATGTVTVSKIYAGGTKTTMTFAELLMKAGVARADLGKYLKTNAAGNYTTFKNYTQHNLKFYYLERGAGTSNCSMRFNIPAIPSDSVSVMKEISNINPSIDSDLDFQFQILVDGVPYANQSFNKMKSGVLVDGATGTTDSEGKFTLKHREGANFPGLSVTSNFEVKELGVVYGEYEQVEITGTDIDVTERPEEGSDPTISTVYDVTTGTLNVSEVQSVLFNNYCNPEYNNNDLYLYKNLKEGTSSNDSFLFDVFIGSSQYFGEVLIQEKTAGGTWTSGTAVTVSNTNPLSLKAGQRAVIQKVPANVSYRVEERNPDTQDVTFDVPTYQVTLQNGSLSTSKAATVSNDSYAMTGTMQLNMDCEVKVVNAPINYYHSITIQKTIDEMDALHGDPIFFFRVENTATHDVFYREVRFTADTAAQTLSGVIANLPSGTYTVTEEQPIRYSFNTLELVSATRNAAVVISGAEATVTFSNTMDGSVTVHYDNAKDYEYFFTDTDEVTNHMQVQR